MAGYYHMKFPERFSLLDRIDYLQRKIIMASIAYYEMDRTFMEDRVYDGLCMQCVELMRECPEREKSQYWYCFHDFDGTTGFDLKDRLNEHDREYLTQLTLVALRPSLRAVKDLPPKEEKDAEKDSVSSEGDMYKAEEDGQLSFLDMFMEER